jgi:hypothetical protein
MAHIVTEMMNSLVSNKFAAASGTDLFAMHIRPEPDAQLIVIPTGGRLPILSVDSVTDQPGVQVYVINPDVSAAWSKANSIHNHYINLKGVIRQAIWAARSSPIYLGELDDGRHKIVVEFQVI